MKRILFAFVLTVCALLISCGSAAVNVPVISDGISEDDTSEVCNDAGGLEEDTAEETKAPVKQRPYLPIDPSAADEKLLLGYTAPEGWYEPRFVTGKVDGGGYKLVSEVMGLKVYYTERRLGLRPRTWGYYREPLPGEVAYFQGVNGLEATGSVDLETWLAMGYTEKEWYELGTYISPVAIERSFCRDEIIDAFIGRAMDYLDTPFVVGASGKPGEGVDCSGLVLQCMYSIGIYPDGLDPVQHSTIEEYNSRLMWADPKFKEVKANELIPGDLVFYRRPWSDSVCHVAIYLGGNKCIEALYADVEILPLYKDRDGYAIKGFKRVIA